MSFHPRACVCSAVIKHEIKINLVWLSCITIIIELASWPKNVSLNFKNNLNGKICQVGFLGEKEIKYFVVKTLN